MMQSLDSVTDTGLAVGRRFYRQFPDDYSWNVMEKLADHPCVPAIMLVSVHSCSAGSVSSLFQLMYCSQFGVR